MKRRNNGTARFALTAAVVAGVLPATAPMLVAQQNPFFSDDEQEAAPAEREEPSLGERDDSATTEVEETVHARREVGPLGQARAWVVQRLARVQRTLNRNLTGFLRAAYDGGGRAGGVALVLLISFVYGIIHAALPGHRKTVLISYYLSEDAPVLHGVGAGALFGLLHAISASAIVFGVYLTAQAAMSMAVAEAQLAVQAVSSAFIIGIGVFLLVGKLMRLVREREDRAAHRMGRRLGLADGGGGGPYVPRSAPKRFLPVVLSAGIVPCPVTTAVLLFSVSLGMIPLGITAALGLSAGLAVALAGMAAVTIVFKTRAIGWLERFGGRLVRDMVEIGGAVVILAFGLATLGALA